MTIATHIIKVKGTFDGKIWDEEKLRSYVDEKFLEIDANFKPDLELFRVNSNEVNVWLFIALMANPETIKKMAEDWVKNHTTEKGLNVTLIEVEDTGYPNGKFLIGI